MPCSRSRLRLRIGDDLSHHMDPIQIALIGVLILLNAFFAASEIAVVSSRKSRMKHLAEEEGNQAAALVLRLTENPGRFLATIQVGITLAGFFASAVSAISLVVLVADWLRLIPLPLVADNSTLLAFLLVTTAISFVTLILGELVPKNLALQNAESFALKVARPIDVLATLAYPVVQILTGTSNLVLRLLGSERQAHFPSITEEEIRSMVDTAEEEGVVDPEEREMIQGIFDFGETQVHEVMVPRVDVVALDSNASPEEALRVIRKTGHSRLPVYEGDIDNIIGVLHAKDLLNCFGDGRKCPRVGELARPPIFVPETKKVGELLRELRQRRSHLAIAIDEYGGTAGLVTLEDLLEEIVGPIQDEYDQQERSPVQMVAPGEAIVDASLSLSELNDLLGLDLEVEGVDTVGGAIYAVLGHVPEPGERAEVDGAVLTVLEVDGPRIERVRVVHLLPKEDQEPAPDQGVP